ncbi:MAG: metallophosphoesterase [Syntrophomonadaceae bacterium]
MKPNKVLVKIICVVGMVLAALLLYTAITGYLDDQTELQYAFNQTAQDPVPYPDAKFAIISDLHYYDLSLGTSGQAFETCFNADRKLLLDSQDLLNLAINEIIAQKVDFVLIPGDLSKDGELICHQTVANALSRFKQHGIGVYVVPGNHDVDNQDAFQFEGINSIPVANITAEQFADIYSEDGYGSAIYHDPDYLSYVAEPVNGLWIIAMDVCTYKSGEEETRGGKISQSQLDWLEEKLQEANRSGKAVIFMEHHGVVEHWTGQSKLHPDYLVQDYPNLGKLLASYHVQVAFTGHYHAQDIAMARFEGSGRIYDVETGSLITAPCPVRYCSFDENSLRITSTCLVGRLHQGTDFESKAYRLLRDAITREADKTLIKYRVPEADAQAVASNIAAGFVAHYEGDEDMSARPEFDGSNLGLWSRLVYSTQGYVVDGLWQDLPPADNEVVLDLTEAS